MKASEYLEIYKSQFAGGMIPFDTVYYAALDEGKTPAESHRLGVYAVLDAFVAQYEYEGNEIWVDSLGMPVSGPEGN